MNNDDWIKTLEKVPVEQRAVFDAMRGHYDDVHLSELHAFLTMLARIEEKQDAAAVDRQQVTTFLQHLVVEMGAVSSGLALLTDEFRQLSEWRATVETRLDRKRARMDAIDARVISIEARLTLGEGRLTQVEARLDALGNPNGG